MNNTEVILKVTNLKTHFDVTKGMFAKKQIVKAVDGVSFEIHKGETFGLVGESGCGKSTLGRTIVKLYEPTEGTIEYKGQDITKLKGKELKEFRKSVQMIFQDPYASLNPRMTVGEIIREPMDIHNIYNSAKEREDRVVELLKIVGLKPDHIRRYPHEFSGGQRQRISIARTLALNPDFIICDEPISALDVSIQAQIINLLKNIQKEMGISYLFVAHDLSMVKHISDRIGVMYLGNMVEIGESSDLYTIQCIRIRRHCCPLCRFRIRKLANPRSESYCRGNCQARWIRRPDVLSAPVVPMQRKNVPKRNLSHP